MNSFFENAADIIQAAATNPLGITALIILICGAIAFVWFRKSSERIRIIVFAVLFIGGLLFVFFISGINEITNDITLTESPETITSAESDPNAIILPEETNQKLSSYIETENLLVSPETRISVIEEALNSYFSLQSGSQEPVNPEEELEEPEEDSLQEVAYEDYNFTLQQCEREGQSIICTVTITNNGESDRVLDLVSDQSSISRTQSFIYDAETGDTYSANYVIFGSDDGNFVATANMPNNVPVKGSIRFNNIPDSVSNLSLFDLFVRDRQYGNLRIEFREVAIQP